jgi:hypothetical protein
VVVVMMPVKPVVVVVMMVVMPLRHLHALLGRSGLRLRLGIEGGEHCGRIGGRLKQISH